LEFIDFQAEGWLAELPADVLTTPLARFTKDGVFTGRYRP
jgi:hypothetical protein